MSASPEDMIKSADVLGTTRDEATNSISAQLGNVIVEQATSPGAEWVQHVGFCSLPSKASPKVTAAQVVCVTSSGRDVCIASKDVRGQQLYANLRPGEAVMYAGGADGESQARVACKDDGSTTIYTTDTNTNAGRGVYLAVTSTELRFEAPWGRIVFDSSGFRVVHYSGARLDLGGIGGLEAPLDTLASYANLSAAMVKIEGPSITVGNGPTYLQCATNPSPVAVPVSGAGALVGGSGSVLISAT